MSNICWWLFVLIFVSVVVLGEDDVVTISTGKILGVSDASMNIRYWKGVPFGESTSGNNRFRPPVARRSWSGVLNCTQYGPGCISDHGGVDTAPVQSEDCLNLNVYAPFKADTPGLLPVVVWIYGGSFAEGFNYGPFDLYDGTYLASTHSVVVVAINYRLGAFGFVVTDQLKGNYGVLDQRLALQWVQTNIHAFGGDRSRVSIWGESAGAMSVGLHLISPGSKGLFHQAMMDSNPAGMLYKAADKARFYGLEFCKLAGCNSTATDNECSTDCLRAANSSVLREAWRKAGSDLITFLEANWGHLSDGFLEFIPNVDGEIVPSEVVPALESGAFHQVPILMGTNENEGATFVFAGVKEALPDFLWDLAAFIVFGDKAEAVIDYYKPRGYSDARQSLSHVFTDYWFRCATEKFATAARKAGQNAYVYRYNHVLEEAGIITAWGFPAICATEVCHASELPFVFHKTSVHSSKVNMTMAADEVQLSTNMVDYFMSFVKTGNPNNSGGGTKLPSWPVWDPNTRVNMNLNITLGTENSLELCNFWDTIGYNH